MEYLKSTFSVSVGSKEYRDNWDKIFRKPEEPRQPTDSKGEAAPSKVDEVAPPDKSE